MEGAGWADSEGDPGDRGSGLIEDKATWPELWQWLIEKLDRLYGVFRKRVKALDLGSLP